VFLAVFKLLTSVQFDPLYCSVIPTRSPGPPVSPPKTNAEVLLAPVPAAPSLPVFKDPPVDQAPTGAPAPVHSSVAPVLLPS